MSTEVTEQIRALTGRLDHGSTPVTTEEILARVDAAGEYVAVPSGAPDEPASPNRTGRRWLIAMAAGLIVLLVGGLVVASRLDFDDNSVTDRPVVPDPVAATPEPTDAPAGTSVKPGIADAPPPTAATTTDGMPASSEVARPSSVPVIAFPSETSGAPVSESTSDPVGVNDRRPLVAIDGNGDAVIFDGDDAAPQLLYDGQDPDTASQLGDGPNLVDRISVTADRSAAFIGLCCAPPIGTIIATNPPAGSTLPTPSMYGFVPTLNPSGTLLATAGPETIGVVDLATGDTANLTEFSGVPWGETVDVTWLDDGTLAVLNRLETSWTLTIVLTDGTTIGAGPTRPFATVSFFPELRFAGTAIAGELAVHSVGTDRVLTAALDQYGNLNGGRGSSLSAITLPTAARSAWYSSPDELVWVDADGVLRVGDVAIPGEYTWAHR